MKEWEPMKINLFFFSQAPSEANTNKPQTGRLGKARSSSDDLPDVGLEALAPADPRTLFGESTFSLNKKTFVQRHHTAVSGSALVG